MLSIIKNLKFIFKPSWWTMLESFDPNWDRKMSELLDKNKFSNFGACTASLGGVEIWVSNQPYSTMMPYKYNSKCYSRASRLTIERAINQYRKDYVDYCCEIDNKKLGLIPDIIA